MFVPPIALATARADPRFAEAAQLVADFEKYGVIVLLHNGETMFGNPSGLGREPLSLWYRYRVCDQDAFDDYLRASGRMEGPDFSA